MYGSYCRVTLRKLPHHTAIGSVTQYYSHDLLTVQFSSNCIYYVQPTVTDHTRGSVPDGTIAYIMIDLMTKALQDVDISVRDICILYSFPEDFPLQLKDSDCFNLP